MNFWFSNLDFFEWIKNILTENLWRLSYYKIDEPHAEDVKSCPERDGNISGINEVFASDLLTTEKFSTEWNMIYS